MKKYRVRFHLGRGKNYQKWQVTDRVKKTKRYFDPSTESLTLINCTLGNQPSVARKIFEGENKTVCAWVDCENVITGGDTSSSAAVMTQYKYNPKKNPHWFTDDNANVDKTDHDVMVTLNRSVYG